MKHFSATTTINASPEKVWAILTDATTIHEWDPGMVRVEGKIAAGERIKPFTTLSSERAFTVKVTDFQPNRRMVWAGGLPLGLFKSARTFLLESDGKGGTKFTTSEDFTGVLLPIFGRTIPDLNPMFADFAKGLKQRAESTK